MCADANIPIAHVHYVASHGQTVCHIPKIDFPNGWETKSTLQVGYKPLHRAPRKCDCPPGALRAVIMRWA